MIAAATSYMNLGELSERRGELSVAVACYQQAAVACEPSERPQALYNLARTHYKLAEWDACVDTYEKLLQTCNNSRDSKLLPEATLSAVLALQEAGHLNAARANCPTLRSLFPKHPYVQELCRSLETPWSAPKLDSPCDRLCVRASWHAPWEPPSTPPPCRGCTRTKGPGSPLYESFPVSYSTRPRGPHPLVLMTARRPEPTLPATLDSLRLAGSHWWPWPKLIIADGYRPQSDFIENWSVNYLDTPRGSAKTFVRVLETALETCPDLELLTFIEDDVEVCLHFFDYLRSIEMPRDLSLVTWFTYEFPGEAKMHEEASRRGWQHPRTYGVPVLARRSCRHFVLAQCVTLTRDAVDRLLRCPRVRDWVEENGHDEMPAWALGDAPYAAHFPVLVQHTGGLSSAVAAHRTKSPEGRDPQAGARTSPDYVGRSFDALSLLPRNFEVP